MKNSVRIAAAAVVAMSFGVLFFGLGIESCGGGGGSTPTPSVTCATCERTITLTNSTSETIW
jgi:hypothetical protein